MIGIHIILVVVGATLVASDPQSTVPAPPYVQSREYFDHAKYYIQNQLPLRTPDNRNVKGKRISAFGIITGVIRDLVKAADNSSNYQPYQVLKKSVPESWRHYLPIAVQAQNALSDLEIKLKTITDYIDNTCGTESIEACNNEVQAKVIRSPTIYGDAALLLLLLGPASRFVVENQAKVDSLTRSREEVPYLLHNVDSKQIKDLVHLLLKVYKQSHRMQYRRFLTT